MDVRQLRYFLEVARVSNFTKAAEDNNAENLLVVQDADMAAKYAQNWDVHRQHSEP